MFHDILHPTDFSETAFRAFEQAVALARRDHAVLHVVHVVTLMAYDPTTMQRGLRVLEDAHRIIDEEMERRMADLADTADHPIEISIRRNVGPADGILEEARSRNADLIVLGTHGGAPIRHLFLGSVAERVVRYADCPVLVLGRRPEVPGRFRRILLPVDFSAASRQAAAAATALARKDEAELHVVHVFEELAPPPYYVAAEALARDPALRTRAVEAMEAFLAPHGPEGIPVSFHLDEGRAARAIVDLAETIEADLIVMGSAGRSGLPRLILGSVTERVLRKSPVPVLTVHPPAEAETT